MITLGITGRSGCGKSTITAMLAERGIPYIDADVVARDVLAPNSPCLPQLQVVFGTDICKDNVLDRRLLADRAFATKEGTTALTNITHPEILIRITALKAEFLQKRTALLVLDAAVIVGTPFAKECDKLLVVSAPLAVSVARIVARDHISAQMAERRLNAQLPIETLLQHADYHIATDNTSGKTDANLIQQVEQLLQQIRRDANAECTQHLETQ